MKVSIVTVCFNSESTIRDTVNSVLSQSYTDIEYIVIDGVSSDSTVDILNEYDSNIVKLVSEPDCGIYDAMNKGISIATGDIIGILNSDDFFESSETIQYVVDSFCEKTRVDIVFGDVVFVAPDDLIGIRRYYSSNRFKPWKLRFGWMPPHPATFVRKSVYEEYGLYSLKFEIAADYEIFVRWLLVERISYRRINRVLVRMRLDGVSTQGMRSSLLLNREIVEACVSNKIYTNLFLMLAKVPFKLMELVRRPRE